MIRNYYILVLLIISIGANAQDEKKFVREGNKFYSGKKYSDAELSYRKALEKQPTSTAATYNLGNSLYRQEKYQDAMDEFNRAGDAAIDKKDKAKAFHNLGNSYMQQQKYQESIDAYKKALRNNPSDIETKYNLSLAQRLMKNPPKQKNQNQQNKNNQNKDNKDKNDKDKKDNKQDQQKNKQDQDKQQKQQQQQQQAGKISKDDAKRMLEAIQNDEKNTQDKLKKEKAAGKKVNPAQNW